MQKITLHFCRICNTKPDQISHHKLHLNTVIHKTSKELFYYKCAVIPHPQLLEKYGTIDVKRIVDMEECVCVIVDKKVKSNMSDNDIKAMANIGEKYDIISNREDLKDSIHDIHNLLRNNGAGYGMNALKVFNIIYGIKQLEKRNILDKITYQCDIHNMCADAQCHNKPCIPKFSDLLAMAVNGEDEELVSIIIGNTLDAIAVSSVRDLLMYEIPRKIKGKIMSMLVKEIEIISKVEDDNPNVQLSGKIYEYFIGRDETAISELGAYFTDRHIVNYIFKKLNIQLEDDGSVGTMIDPFGGSGGFTTGYIHYINDMKKNINWDTELNKIYHFDMNDDVIKSAGLEFFLLTGTLPDMRRNVSSKNSFADEFSDCIEEKVGVKRFKYVITNPPYGGDKNKKSSRIEKRAKVSKELNRLIHDDTISDEMKVLFKKQLLDNKQKDRKDNIEKDKNKVTLRGSSKRINAFAYANGLSGTDKEAVSLIQIMDMVEAGGVGCGVLKEGVFFDKKYRSHRKVLLEKFNVECVISVPSSEFENTTTKTSIVIFRNTGKATERVCFYNMSVDKFTDDEFEIHDGFVMLTGSKGDIKNVNDTLVSEATLAEILANDNCSLNGKDYNKKEINVGDGYKLMKLSDVCEFKAKSKRKASFGKSHGQYPFYTSSSVVKRCNEADYNEDLLIVGNGGIANIQMDNKFSCSDHNYLLSSKYTKYLYYLFTGNMNILSDGFRGSVLKNLSKKYLSNIQIPIPTDPARINHWVEKISAPFDEYHTKSIRIKELEGAIATRIKEIVEHEECDGVELGDICEYIKTGQNKTPDDRKGTLYPYYGTAGITGYTDHYLFEGIHILIARNGTMGNCFLIDGKIFPSDHIFVLKIKNIYNLKYIYFNLMNQRNDIDSKSNGSIIKGISKINLSSIKIPIPKDRTIIDNLNPMFAEIERLQAEVKHADMLYHQYIDELAKEAIKSDTVENPAVAEVAHVDDGKQEVDAPAFVRNRRIARNGNNNGHADDRADGRADVGNIVDGIIDGGNVADVNDKKDKPPEAGGAVITEADLKAMSKTDLANYIKSHGIPHGRGSGISLSDTRLKLINHILKNL